MGKSASRAELELGRPWKLLRRGGICAFFPRKLLCPYLVPGKCVGDPATLSALIPHCHS